jgi:hypothetical protein
MKIKVVKNQIEALKVPIIIRVLELNQWSLKRNFSQRIMLSLKQDFIMLKKLIKGENNEIEKMKLCRCY